MKDEKSKTAYQKAGVDIDEANKAVDSINVFLQSTYSKRVIRRPGLFAGLTDVSFLKEYRNPVLVQSIDGVGTKSIVAEKMKKLETIGEDIVNHCVNDIIVHGAEPITFLDYIASAKLKRKAIKEIVSGMARACQAIGCQRIKLPIVAGETAEMPDVYKKGKHDLVGCVTGVVERDKIIDGSKIEVGDIMIGLLSDGFHTNGYSLARKAFFKTAGYSVDTCLKELGCTVGEELLKPHKCYYKPIHYLVSHYTKISNIEIHGIAHITGGGFYDNIGRLLPDRLQAEINYQWSIPPVFQMIQKIEKVSNEEMRRVFNLGIGMVLIVPKEFVKEIRNVLFHQEEPKSIMIGEIKKRKKGEDKVVFTY